MDIKQCLYPALALGGLRLAIFRADFNPSVCFDNLFFPSSCLSFSIFQQFTFILIIFIFCIPPREHSGWGPFDSLSNVYATGERILKFHRHQRKSAFFEIPKSFTVRMGGWLVIKRILGLCRYQV